MKKMFSKATLCIGVLGVAGVMSMHTASAQSLIEPESLVSSRITGNKAESIEIPTISAGRDQASARLSIIDGQVVISIAINLEQPQRYLSARFFTHEDGIYQSKPYNDQGDYKFVLASNDLEILKQQLESSSYATMGIDILNSDGQRPIAMLYISDIIEAYNSLSHRLLQSSSLTVQEFKIGQDETIKGTVDTRGTTDKDTLMLSINNLGRRLLHIPAMSEEEQTDKYAFEIYAVDLVNTIDKRVTIVHIKDGKVVSEIDVPLLP